MLPSGGQATGTKLPTVAIISPSQHAYSETFIQAHRSVPNVNIRYYYRGQLPTMIEGKGALAALAPRRKPAGEFHSLKPAEYALAASLRNEEVDCVLAEFGTAGAAVLRVCELLNLPLIVYFRGYDASEHRVLETHKESYPRLFAYAARVMAVSHSIIERLKSLGCPPQKIVFHSSAPAGEFFEICPTYNEKLLVGLGRFVDKKAPYYTILAFQGVLARHPSARLVIGGDGVLWNTCANLIRHAGLEAQVSLPKVLTPEEFRGLLQNARAFVQHSITAANGDTEGSPLAIMEAGAAALPAVSTTHAGISHIVEHGKTGLLVEEHDVRAMTEHMCTLLENKDYARQLGEAARARMQSMFNLDQRLKTLSDIIHEVVATAER